MAFFTSLESSWKVDVSNGLALLISFKTQVMAKRRVGNQIGNLIFDQKKLRIDPIYLATEGVQHTVKKFLIKTITLL